MVQKIQVQSKFKILLVEIKFLRLMTHYVIITQILSIWPDLKGSPPKLEAFSLRGESIDGVVRQISASGDTVDGVDGPSPAGSSPKVEENEAEVGEKSLEIRSVMPNVLEFKLLQGRRQSILEKTPFKSSVFGVTCFLAFSFD